jgi:hypothetical protein
MGWRARKAQRAAMRRATSADAASQIPSGECAATQWLFALMPQAVVSRVVVAYGDGAEPPRGPPLEDKMALSCAARCG